MGILEEIIANKKREVTRQKEAIPVSTLQTIIEEDKYVKKSFRQALLNSSSGIIAEFKRKSPSKGWIFQRAEVAEVASAYESAGATALSILTDEAFFGGSFDDFKTARKKINIPLLRKDFIVDAYQIYQSRAMGADVILLIASALTPRQIMEFSHLAHQLDLEILLEIHHEEELESINSEVDVIGINNRNLSTFITDVQISFDLGAKIPKEWAKISESGISEPEIVLKLRQAGFNGFLMGENFMKTSNPGGSLHQFITQLK